jgi:hypothetical protein
MAYFLISVSNRINLELCIKYALAGFTNSINGLWAYEEIQEGDFISFLYGAKVFNLYRVEKKEALKNADRAGPWAKVTFSMSGKTCYFPFRLYLKPIREFTESMVRPEFAYVAENLLLRGGYRKTHFQADQTTLQSVSQMGIPFDKPTEMFSNDEHETFTPQLTWNKALVSPPEVYYFQEIILQSLVKQWLSQNLQTLFNSSSLNSLRAEKFEVLGEKALPEGYVDILIKEAIPTGYSQKIIVEVKSNKSQPKDIIQLESYMREMGRECIAGILIAKDFSRKVKSTYKMPKEIRCFTYSFGEIDPSGKYSTSDLKSRICIKPVPV